MGDGDTQARWPSSVTITGWQLALAADLLRDSDATIGAVGRQVGYGSSSALSTAFARVRGISARQYRDQGGSTGPSSGIGPAMSTCSGSSGEIATS